MNSMKNLNYAKIHLKSHSGRKLDTEGGGACLVLCLLMHLLIDYVMHACPNIRHKFKIQLTSVKIISCLILSVTLIPYMT